MKLYEGTSGYSYKEWRGSFYPEKLAQKKWLSYYAEKLPSVEINNSFYRMPKAETLEGWKEQVGERFHFTIKSPGRITHKARLVDAQESLDYLWKTVQSLGEYLGPILFQLPPFLRSDPERLKNFLGELPKGLHASFEFRHISWLEDDAPGILREFGAAWCASDGEKIPAMAELHSTTNWGYLRLRRSDYTEDDLRDWAERVHKQAWERVYVYFKHEDEGRAPDLAQRFRKQFEEL